MVVDDLHMWNKCSIFVDEIKNRNDMFRLYTQYADIPVEEWSALVERSECASWFQTPEAYAFYEDISEHVTPFVVAIGEGETLYGVIVGYIPRDTYAIRHYFSRRAVVNGGALLDGMITTEAFGLLVQTLVSVLYKRVIYIEIRNLYDNTPWRDMYAECGFVYQPHLNFQVDCISREGMWQRMKSNRRRQIQSALSAGAEIVADPTEEEVQAYYEILCRLYKKKIHKPLPSKLFFLSLFRQPSVRFLLVRYRGKVIGGVICPVLAHRIIYEWYICGLDHEYSHLYPSVLATYAAMEYASAHGISVFDMMGAGKPDEAYGVRTFKQRFGGRELEYGRWLYVCNPTLYRLGVSVLRTMRCVDLKK